jgi:hypothetical protein
VTRTSLASARSLTGRLPGLLRPRSLHVLLGEVRPRRPRDDLSHLHAVVSWLRSAHDAAGGGGLAARYDLASGWEAPYPETTGYTIGTFLHHAELFGEAESRERAVAMGNWLLTVQLPDGSIPAGLHREGGPAKSPEVFNAGQVLLGFLALAQTTGEERFAAGARRAASWIASVQEEAGCWKRFSLQGVPHAYYARVAWALARAGEVLDEPRFQRSADRAVRWVCAQQVGNGWIEHMGFSPDAPALTHTIAYTIEGLLETALLQSDGERAWEAAVQATQAVEAAYRRDESGARLRRANHLAATFGPDWTSRDRYSCVTGSVQMALCGRRLDAIDGRPALRSFADELIESAKTAQPLDGAPPGVRGGVPGSAPAWGRYGSFRYLNWAAKFMADALMDRISGGLPRDRYG